MPRKRKARKRATDGEDSATSFPHSRATVAAGRSKYFTSEQTAEKTPVPSRTRISKARAAGRLSKHFCNSDEQTDDVESVENENSDISIGNKHHHVEDMVVTETKSKYFGQVALNLSEESSDSEEETQSRRKRKKKSLRIDLQRKRLKLDRKRKNDFVSDSELTRNIMPGKFKESRCNEDAFDETEGTQKEDGSLCEYMESVGKKLAHEQVSQKAGEKCMDNGGCVVKDQGLPLKQVKAPEMMREVKDVQPACASDSDVEWEDVDAPRLPEPSQEGAKAIEITMQSQTKSERMMSCLQRAITKYRRKIQVNIHKVHLLCLVAIAKQRSNLCNIPLLQASCLSLVPDQFLNIKKKTFRIDLLTNLTKWLTSTLSYCPHSTNVSDGELLSLMDGIASRQLNSSLQFSMVLVCLLRLFAFRCRLMMSMQPLPLKLIVANTKQAKSGVMNNLNGKSRKRPKTLARTKQKRKSARQVDYTEQVNSDMDETNTDKTIDGKLKSSATSGTTEDNECEQIDHNIRETSFRKTVKSRGNTEGRRRAVKRSCTRKVSTQSVTPSKAPDCLKQKAKGRKVDFKHEDSDFELVAVSSEETESDKSDLDVSELKEIQSLNDQQRVLKKSRRVSQSNKKQCGKSISGDVDGKTDYWTEVFLPSANRWICINPLTGVVDSVEDITDHATHSMSYVLGIEQDGSVKDVTARYAADWMTGARKRRVDSSWWRETLLPLQTKHKKEDQREDSLIQAMLERQPFPCTIGDFKNHPLYTLQRHLLKFEAIYPEQEPLGYFKGESIYPREFVRTLHSRETWLKHAKMVKAGEKPYKMVKQRPKRNEPQHFRDQLRLEVFGEWQTEPYKADPVKDGKVPRNAYGNLELFQPCMLPEGAAHVQIPNIHKVAKKLDIDYALAMVGWDIHSGFNHPVFDGIIIAKEFEQTLIEAWEQQQEEMERKVAEKHEKIVIGRWRKLIKGLLIQERLKRKYDFQDDSEVADTVSSEAVSTSKLMLSNADKDGDTVGCLKLPPVVY